MRERLDHISIAMERGGEANDVRLPWKSRDYLLRKLKSTEGAEGIVKAFEDVGATRPVELTMQQKAQLYRLLDGGQTILYFFPGGQAPEGEVGENGALYAVVGHVQETLDLDQNLITSFTLRGQAKELCSLLD